MTTDTLTEKPQHTKSAASVSSEIQTTSKL